MHWRNRAVIAAAITAAIAGSGGLVAQEPAPIGAGEPTISDTHFALRPRADRAAAEAATSYAEWLGPLADSSKAMPGHPHATVASRWSSPVTMDVEAAAAYDAAQAWWGNPTAADAFVIRGIAWYLQSRVVERLFDFTFQYHAYRGEAMSFFGGAVPYGFSNLRLGRLAAGVGRGELLFEREGHSWPPMARSLPDTLDSAALRVTLALTSIEHALGWPVLQGALFEASRHARTGPMPLARLGHIMDEATGVGASRSLNWYQQQPAADLAVESVTSDACTGQQCVRTRVNLRGGSALPQPVTVRVKLADGQQVDMVWDGAGSRTFDVEGPAQPSRVELDPERINMLDTNVLDNGFRVPAPTNAPLTKWMTRWIVWLQDGMLSYSSLF